MALTKILSISMHIQYWIEVSMNSQDIEHKQNSDVNEEP